MRRSRGDSGWWEHVRSNTWLVFGLFLRFIDGKNIKPPQPCCLKCPLLTSVLYYELSTRLKPICSAVNNCWCRRKFLQRNVMQLARWGSQLSVTLCFSGNMWSSSWIYMSTVAFSWFWHFIVCRVDFASCSVFWNLTSWCVLLFVHLSRLSPSLSRRVSLYRMPRSRRSFNISRLQATFHLDALVYKPTSRSFLNTASLVLYPTPNSISTSEPPLPSPLASPGPKSKPTGLLLLLAFSRRTAQLLLSSDIFHQ